MVHMDSSEMSRQTEVCLNAHVHGIRIRQCLDYFLGHHKSYSNLLGCQLWGKINLADREFQAQARHALPDTVHCSVYSVDQYDNCDISSEHSKLGYFSTNFHTLFCT